MCGYFVYTYVNNKSNARIVVAIIQIWSIGMIWPSHIYMYIRYFTVNIKQIPMETLYFVRKKEKKKKKKTYEVIEEEKR